MSFKVFSFLSTYFSCKKCCEVPSEPILLPCNHLYCKKCLHKKENETVCPFCLFFFFLNIKENLQLKMLITHLNEMNDIQFQSEYYNIITVIFSLGREANIINFFLRIQTANREKEFKYRSGITSRKRKHNEMAIMEY